MNKKDFLQIFKSGFHKLKLKRIVKYGESKNPQGKKYENCLGLFEFVPPEQIWGDGDEEFDYDFFKNLLKEFSGELSNCITHKFTRKKFSKGKIDKKITEMYVFDVIPKNIVDFRFYPESRTMRLVSKGFLLVK